jgi:hypothetical protein
MFILTKNKIEENKKPEIEKMLISKRTPNIKGGLVINNPKHIKLIDDFDIKEYNYIYEVDDYILQENTNLLNHLRDKDDEYIIKTLTNTHEDNVYVQDLISHILTESKFDAAYLGQVETMLKRLISEIYFENKQSPKDVILKLRTALKNKGENLTQIEALEYRILKNRTTRWALIKTSRTISALNRIINTAQSFENINTSLKEKQNFVYLSDKEYLTVYEANKPGRRLITQNDLYTSYRYRSLADLKDNSSVNYKKLKYIYIASNNYILKQLSYMDFLRCNESITALTNMFRGFTEENIDFDMFTEEFLEEVIAGNHEELKEVIGTKYMELVPEDLKELYVIEKPVKKKNSKPKVEVAADNNEAKKIEDKSDVLSFVSDMYNM